MSYWHHSSKYRQYRHTKTHHIIPTQPLIIFLPIFKMKLIFTSQPSGYLTLKFELTTFTSVMFSMMSERERINWILRQRLVIFCEWEVSLLSARRRLSANWQEGDNRKLNISKHNFNQSIYSFSLLFTSNFRCTQLPSGMILIYKMNLAVKMIIFGFCDFQLRPLRKSEEEIVNVILGQTWLHCQGETVKKVALQFNIFTLS